MKLPLTLAALALLGAPQAKAQVLSVELLTSGINKPTHVVEDPSQPGRLFVVERNRGVDVVINGVLQATPFLNLSAEVSSGTQGIMSIALHPDYALNGRFFLVYTDIGQMSHVVEYTVSADPNVADPASRVQILGPEAQPGVVHNWNQLLFGPDGMLYITTGDGVLSSTNVTNLAQDLDSIFGKMLRLDVDLPAPYIPADNPYVGQPGVREEIFLCGLRQPWRFDFDPGTGNLWISDVGDNSHEEITILAAGTAAGANLGWKCQIGREDCEIGLGCINCNDPSFTRPAWEYQHVGGHCAIIGGGVYRGAAIPWLQGKYLFSDYCTAEIWSMRTDGTRVFDWVEHSLPTTNPGINRVISFGRLLSGEMLILDQIGGEVWKIVPGDSCGSSGGQLTCPATVNSTGYVSVLGATGSLTISDNDLRLYVGNVPTNQFGYMLMSQNTGNVPMFGGSQGTLCLGPPFVRFSQNVLTADALDGTLVFQPDMTALPNNTTFLPGDSWIFQYWFRDANPSSTSNTSDAVVVTFCP